MNLTSVRVQNYKCIDDSGEFSVQDLTCLAGKNESGKTALLQALRRLNPVEDSEREFDGLKEYPRRRRREMLQGKTKHVLTTTWELSQEDHVAVNRVVGPCALRSKTVTAKRGYDNNTEWNPEIDESCVVAFVVSRIVELSESSKKQALRYSSLRDLHSYLQSLNEPNEGDSKLQNLLEENFPGNDPESAVSAVLNEVLPHFLYFSTYGTLPGRVSVEDIANKAGNETQQNERDRLFLALLALAGTDINTLINASQQEELIANLESVSNQVSDEIFEYWSQNRNLEVQFGYDEARRADPSPFDSGHVMSLRVRNSRHRVTVGFDERSAGFVWFFSFLVWFSQMEKKYGDNLIILLDEPGLSLHGKAQGDLLRYIKEKLLPKYQVLYTTHSPFMIDIENILNVRTVEDVVTREGRTLGTKVGDRVLSADSDTLFPLRAALGYDITQSLFVGEHSLLVEGPSDMLYLRWFSRELAKKGRSHLDSRWTITPVGGLPKLGSFVSLFAGNELHIAVLTDFHSGDKKKVRELAESGLLKAGHLFTANEYADREEADIEDMIGRDFYIDLVNQCYGLEGAKQLPASQPHGAAMRVVEEAKRHFQTVATEGPVFDHLSPAVYLFEHGSDFGAGAGFEAALDRFEQLFKGFNALMP